MNRIAAVVFVACLAALHLGAPAVAGPNDKKPVRKPVVDLDASAKQRRQGQVLPGDSSPASAKPAPQPVATPTPAAPAPAPAPQQQPPAAAQPASPPSVAAQPKVEARKEATPAPKLRVSASSVSGGAAGAQVRPFSASIDDAKRGAPEPAWTELSAAWTGETPLEVRVGVHAPVVLRVAGMLDEGVLTPDSLVTLWPLARVVIAPELVEGRWIVGVRVARGQVTLQPDVIPNPDPTAARRWASVVRTPERSIPIAGSGARVGYDLIRHTRVWAMMSE